MARRVLPASFELRSIQDGALDETDDIRQIAILRGNLITDTINTTSTSVEHRLGRVPVGWFVVDRTGDARVYRDSTVNMTSLTIPLIATTQAEFKLWIF